ncbi:MAG: RHS repeat-associated core domain-containing protein [Nitrospira sp.]
MARIKTGGTFARTNVPPTLASASYNANNQQTAFGAATETYDLHGNLATFTDASGTTTYTWNARNQLTGINKTGFTASFTYDSFGRRTGKSINGTTTNFVYDGLNPVQEKNGGTVTANLLTGLGIDEFFTRTDGVGSRALLPDSLGSTVALGDGTGTLQTQYTYEPFGFTTQTGSSSTSSYKYTGREDDGTGLMYYRARYYQPRLQRFIAEDPLRFRGRDVNLFAYALNNPTNWTDASGTGPIGVGGALACAAIDILDAHDTFKRLGKLSDDINALNTVIRPLEERCSSGKGSDQDVERLRELKLEGLRKSAELTEGQLKGYIPNIALFFICAAIGLLPY